MRAGPSSDGGPHASAIRSAMRRRGGPDGLLTSADVLNIKFQATAFRSGYEQDEIDEFLDDVAQALSSYEVRG